MDLPVLPRQKQQRKRLYNFREIDRAQATNHKGSNRRLVSIKLICAEPVHEYLFPRRILGTTCIQRRYNELLTISTCRLFPLRSNATTVPST